MVVVLTGAAFWYVQPWASKGLAVTTETVTPPPLIRVLAVNGRLAPLHPVDVKTATGGKVLALPTAEGDEVAQGAVLARIDALAQQTVVRQAMAGLDAELVVQAQIMLGKYTILSPVAGTVLARNAEVGQTVEASTVLFSMADLGQLVVQTDVDETYATQISPGLAAVLQLKGETDKRDGHVSFVAAQVDTATGGLAVKISFDAPVAAPVGLTVTAKIIVDSQVAAIAVPRAAVIKNAQGSAVFLPVDGHALRRDVTVVDWPSDRVEVTQGLAAGDIIITDAAGLTDGLAITVPAVAAP